MAFEQAGVLGEDPALLSVLRQRLAEAGVSPDDDGLGVLVVAVGSSNEDAGRRSLDGRACAARGGRDGQAPGWLSPPDRILALPTRRSGCGPTAPTAW